MNRVIEIAKVGSGFVNPDPLVGAVLVKKHNIIGEGYLKFYGAENAEIVAIKSAKGETFGAELYLNMEPSLNKEDMELILKSKIKKINIGIINPKFKGKNLSILSEKGIEIEIGILKEDCEELNEIYLHFIREGTPFVFTKWAMTLDGKLATRTGDSKWISSQESLKFVHELRQRVAAIMVGENTVKMDNPMLTTRLEGTKISNPLRVIISKYGDIPDDSNVLSVDKNTKTIIISSRDISFARETYLLNRKIEVLKLQEHNGHIDFKHIVKALGERGIDSLYIEGGSGILGSAFESGIVNVVYVAVSPKIVGGRDAITPVGGRGIERMRDAIVLKKVTHKIVGNDVIFKGYV
jgi:diaminohydroxyphosphoribosylaminopyrimidine deaminase/5-amino-6-(5-phosphoribosylamino)uracil reductase